MAGYAGPGRGGDAGGKGGERVANETADDGCTHWLARGRSVQNKMTVYYVPGTERCHEILTVCDEGETRGETTGGAARKRLRGQGLHEAWGPACCYERVVYEPFARRSALESETRGE